MFSVTAKVEKRKLKKMWNKSHMKFSAKLWISFMELSLNVT